MVPLCHHQIDTETSFPRVCPDHADHRTIYAMPLTGWIVWPCLPGANKSRIMASGCLHHTVPTRYANGRQALASRSRRAGQRGPAHCPGRKPNLMLFMHGGTGKRGSVAGLGVCKMLAVGDAPEVGACALDNVAPDRRRLPFAGGAVSLASPEADDFLSFEGFSGRERFGRWTNACYAAFDLSLPSSIPSDIIVKIEAQPFVAGVVLPKQTVAVAVNGVLIATWTLSDGQFRTRAVFVDRSVVGSQGKLVVSFALPDCVSPKSLEINDDQRSLGIRINRVEWEAVDGKPLEDSSLWLLGRAVGGEARKSYDKKVASGFWSRFITGPNVLDIGFKGYGAVHGVVTIMEGAIGVDLDYPGYDGKRLPFPDASQDAVYSSHCLEHIPAHIIAIQEWYRVTKVGGHIITVVPHACLYERKRRPPSRWNQDHQRFYTSASLLAEFEAALSPNTFRVRLLEENDEGYGYDDDPEKHPQGAYEITLVIEKIKAPVWRVAD
jgi:SAM-dependent methyltransferase